LSGACRSGQQGSPLGGAATGGGGFFASTFDVNLPRRDFSKPPPLHRPSASQLRRSSTVSPVVPWPPPAAFHPSRATLCEISPLSVHKSRSASPEGGRPFKLARYNNLSPPPPPYPTVQVPRFPCLASLVACAAVSCFEFNLQHWILQARRKCNCECDGQVSRWLVPPFFHHIIALLDSWCLNSMSANFLAISCT
jgi:hypothetical protein